MNRSLGLIVFVTLMGAVVGNVLGKAVPGAAGALLQQSAEFGRFSLGVATFSVHLSLNLSVAGALGLLVALILILRK